MSAGAFTRVAYETDNGPIHGIRIQPETAALIITGVGTNVPSTEVVTGEGSVSVSRGRRANGINARLVRVRFTGTPPTGYKPDSDIALPWFIPSTFNEINIPANPVGTYLGVAIRVTGKTSEKVN